MKHVTAYILAISKALFLILLNALTSVSTKRGYKIFNTQKNTKKTLNSTQLNSTQLNATKLRSTQLNLSLNRKRNF
ncbi:hypothetical protein BCV72DRAFT_96846 [Rhizopus microsporus var. microsporus]|uniref:Uncharacterized protein n=1 Tax=Rhizopus microsporus var. microsporus TaxID=86635 RepID=A0A1X0R834_RHIZD|nr:hypothetical protein BCV72DRAFT_96846 [Rhizopus microsporus var. microsporus]